ncbi:hypothetical protein FKM82_024609 [Ascaphus truei]
MTPPSCCRVSVSQKIVIVVGLPRSLICLERIKMLNRRLFSPERYRAPQLCPVQCTEQKQGIRNRWCNSPNANKSPCTPRVYRAVPNIPLAV